MPSTHTHSSAEEHDNEPLPPHRNPFSPPASVLSFSSDSPAATPGQPTGPYLASGSGYFPEPQGAGVSNGSSPRSTYLREDSALSSSRLRDTFTSPPSRPVTISSSPITTVGVTKARMKSTMLEDPSKLEKPWLDRKDKAPKIAYLLTYAVMLLGVACAIIKGYFDWKTTSFMSDKLCSVIDEDFTGSTDIFGDNGLFMREVDMSGFGNGEFEMTTADDKNSYIKNGQLYITPTFTSDDIGLDSVKDGAIYNITGCSYNTTHGHSYTDAGMAGEDSSSSGDDFDEEAYYKACSAVSNATTGAIIPPIQTARLRTRTASIRYGRVEIKAKIPTGDWIWPALWMLPVDNAYGAWPLSGEIDIMEARGNGIEYPAQGINYVRGSLNWGPLTWLNAVYKTYGWWNRRRGSYADDFHTYALEWNEDFMRIYVDSRLHHMIELKLNKQSFWERGDFPAVVQNGTESIALKNPWINGTNAAPFDQPFYLIISMAVGGTNGWFPDAKGDKPWLDNSATAPRDFLNAQEKWGPSWSTDNDATSFIIDSVKMWETCN